MNIFANDDTSFITVITSPDFEISGRLVGKDLAVLLDSTVMESIANAIAEHQTATVPNLNSEAVYLQPGYYQFEHVHLTNISIGTGQNFQTLIFPSLDLLKQIAPTYVARFLENIQLKSDYKDLG